MSHQVLTTLRTSGADAPAVCAVIGDVELESVRSGSAASVPLVGLLEKAADEISGRSEARIRRLQLVRYIATLAINPGGPKTSINVMMDQLRKEWPEPADPNAPRVRIVSDTMVAWPNPAAMAGTFLRGLAQQRFWWWYWGLPGLGGECRWLRGQRRYLPKSKTFKTMMYSLTPAPPTRRSVSADAINQLAARAFLADIRSAYKPRLWHPGTWALGRRPALLIDGLADKMAELLFQARVQEGKPDPLLVVVVPPTGRYDKVTALGDPAVIAYPRATRSVLALLGSVLAIALAAVLTSVVLPSFSTHPAKLTSAASPTPGQVRPQPVSSATGPGSPCPRLVSSSDGETDLQPWPEALGGVPECVGFSSSVPFINPGAGEKPAQILQDERTEYDQKQIFALNARVDGAAKTPQGHDRGVIELVYFAGLTEGPIEDYDSAEAEELEGLYAAQEVAFDDTEEPYLKVIVANGGSEMKDAAVVAPMIINRFRNDPEFLGVVGLDRSTTDVKSAVTDFTNAGIPMLATTLSADGPDGIDLPNGSKTPSPYFFSLSPTNTAEATLMLQYIQQAVHHYFNQPAQIYPSGGAASAQRIMIYQPADDPGDLYISTLVHDLRTLHVSSPGLPALPEPIVTDKPDDPRLCGSSTVDIYAGRHDRPPGGPNKYDDFTVFLNAIGQYCYKDNDVGPFVIADDGVTRFIADPADRAQLHTGKLPISYVTKGIKILSTGTNCLHQDPEAAKYAYPLGTFCTTYAAIATQIQRNVLYKGQHLQLLWTGERVGLAYDAAQMFLQAATFVRVTNGEILLKRADVPGQFENPAVGYRLVTGSVRFSRSQRFGVNTSDGIPLAIVRIQISAPTALPTCEFTGQGRYLLSPIPNMDPSNAPCLGQRGL